MLRHIYIYIYIEIPITWSNSWFGVVGTNDDAKSLSTPGASNFNYRRAQSVLRSTDDFNFSGLIHRLILVCHIFSILLSFAFQRRSTELAYITPKLRLEETA